MLRRWFHATDCVGDLQYALVIHTDFATAGRPGFGFPINSSSRASTGCPISVRAALAEAGVWTGMAYLIP